MNGTLWKQIISGAFILIFGTSIGLNITSSNQVARTASDVDHLKKSEERTRAEASEERKRTDARIFELSELIKSQNDLARDLIHLVQSQLPSSETTNKRKPKQ